MPKEKGILTHLSGWAVAGYIVAGTITGGSEVQQGFSHQKLQPYRAIGASSQQRATRIDESKGVTMAGNLLMTSNSKENGALASYILAELLFERTRPFTTEEVAMHSKVLKKRSVIKGKLYDI